MPHDNQRDLVVHPNRYAFILDETKGEVRVHVGPLTSTISQNEKLVKWDEEKKRFQVANNVGDALFSWKTAPEGWYVVLKNPAQDGKKDHPPVGHKGETDLDVGRKINIHGPVNFALWPGQMAKVVQGHILRNNQYLVARVYNADAANEFKEESKVEAQSPEIDPDTGEPIDERVFEGRDLAPEIYPETFKMGELLIIQGTAVGFYMPPTGIEIVAEKGGKFLREAVTLERLEYCILLDQDGNKRYVQGPDVVFPRATEHFVEDKDNKRKFKAMELNDQMGIYIKIIETYEEDDKTFNAGEELFITGKEQRIYFPRREHMIIKYGEKAKHYATVIPSGEARYVLDKDDGPIDLVRGPKSFLPDPRSHVIVRRTLSPNLVNLLYPGNEEARVHNEALIQITEEERGLGNDDPTMSNFASSYLSDVAARRSVRSRSRGIVEAAAGADGEHLTVPSFEGSMYSADSAEWAQEQAGTQVVADEASRGTAYSPPRTITIDSKYDGAVAVQVWSGYAMLLISKSGDRRVVVGPQTVLLEYDETPEVFSLSKGMPKGSKGKKKDVYLRVTNNRVSDMIDAVTKDFVEIHIKLAFRVNFVDTDPKFHKGDGTSKGFKPERWFAVENYTQLISDHMGSIVRNAVKRYGIEEFSEKAIDIIRDTILGPKTDGVERAGKFFQENFMRIYDVEVLGLGIPDQQINDLLQGSQRRAVQAALKIKESERDLEVHERIEVISQKVEIAKHKTIENRMTIQLAQTIKEFELGSQKILNEIKIKEIANTGETQHQTALDEKQKHELGREKSKFTQLGTFADEDQKRSIKMIEADTKAWVDRAKAIDPEFKAQIKLFGEQIFAASLAEHIGAHALLKGNTMADVFSQLVASTPGLERVMANIPALKSALGGAADATPGEEIVVTGTEGPVAKKDKKKK